MQPLWFEVSNRKPFMKPCNTTSATLSPSSSWFCNYTRDYTSTKKGTILLGFRGRLLQQDLVHGFSKSMDGFLSCFLEPMEGLLLPHLFGALRWSLSEKTQMCFWGELYSLWELLAKQMKAAGLQAWQRRPCNPKPWTNSPCHRQLPSHF